MALIVIFFLLGLVLFSFELIVPGGILGALGGMAILASSVIALIEYGPAVGFLVFFLGLSVGLLCLVLELKVLPKTRVGQRFFLKESIQGTSQKAIADREIIGKECEALTDLAPTGVVLCEGKQYEAFSQSGFLERGRQVKVVDVDNFRLKVTKLWIL